MNLLSGNAPTENIYVFTSTIENCRILFSTAVATKNESSFGYSVCNSLENTFSLSPKIQNCTSVSGTIFVKRFRKIDYCRCNG